MVSISNYVLPFGFDFGYSLWICFCEGLVYFDCVLVWLCVVCFLWVDVMWILE